MENGPSAEWAQSGGRAIHCGGLTCSSEQHASVLVAKHTESCWCWKKAQQSSEKMWEAREGLPRARIRAQVIAENDWPLCCSWVIYASNGSIFSSNQATIKIIASVKAQCCQVFSFIIFPQKYLEIFIFMWNPPKVKCWQFVLLY